METRRKFDEQFKEGAVRIVRETGKPIAQVARELGINEGTLGKWVAKDRRAREGSDGRLSEVSERSWRGCAGKMRSWRWSVMSSSARSPSGSRKRCGGEPGRPDRGPEGSARHPARDRLPGAGGVTGLVL